MPLPIQGIIGGASSIVTGIINGKQQVQFIQTSSGTVFKIEVSMKETHTRESPPTEFPVENAQTISDHIIVKPFGLEIDGVISDFPLSALSSLATSAVSSIVPGPVIAAVGAGVGLFNAVAGTKSPSAAAFNQLLQLQDSRQPFDVLTSLKRYSSMFIKNISVDRDKDSSQSLNFKVSLVQLILVSPQSVSIAKFANSDLSADELNAGKQELENPILQKFQQGQAAFTRTVGG